MFSIQDGFLFESNTVRIIICYRNISHDHDSFSASWGASHTSVDDLTARAGTLGNDPWRGQGTVGGIAGALVAAGAHWGPICRDGLAVFSRRT